MKQILIENNGPVELEIGGRRIVIRKKEPPITAQNADERDVRKLTREQKILETGVYAVMAAAGIALDIIMGVAYL